MLAGLPSYQLDRVQSILNFAARLIYGRAKYDHVISIPRDKQHWLHVPQRIQYKCYLLMYKAILGLEPIILIIIIITIITTHVYIACKMIC